MLVQVGFGLRLVSCGGVETGPTVPPVEDDGVILTGTDYISGTYSTLAEAVATAGSEESTIYVSRAQTVADDLTVPVNITLRFEGSGLASVTSGKTLTIEGYIQSSPRHIFGGSGDVVLENGAMQAEVFAEWWGVVADGTPGNALTGTDNKVAMNRAILSLPSKNANAGTMTMRMAGYCYRFDGSIGFINNAANRYRRNLVLAGIPAGRRGNDVKSGTVFTWGGNDTDPMIDLQSRNCTIQDIQMTVASGKTLSAAIKSDDDGGLDQIITANWFRNLNINADGGGTLVDGFRIGESGGANQEHHRFEGCVVTFATNAGIFADNGTGQMKFIQVEDCAFLSCRYGWLAQIASASFLRCNFSGITETCMRWSGGAYDACSITDCDNENSAQFIYAPGVDLSIIDTRLSCEGAYDPPSVGQEYIYGCNKLLMLNTQVQNDTEDVFAIRLVDGGYFTAINCDFPDREFMSFAVNWSASFTSCPRISDGIRRTINFLTPDGSVNNTAEFAGMVALSNQGTVTALNTPASKTARMWFDANTNYGRLSQAGAYPNKFVTVHPHGDTGGATATFSNAAGSVAAGTYDYGYTIITAAGESATITFVSGVTNGATGQWILTNIPLGPAGTTSRKIYRQPHSSPGYKLVATLADNTTTTYTDTAASPSTDPVSGGAGLISALQLGTLTPSSAIAVAGDTHSAWDGYIEWDKDGTIIKVPYKL